jgi:rare lipoprotein A (peptidoglycan hydrolase)
VAVVVLFPASEVCVYSSRKLAGVTLFASSTLGTAALAVILAIALSIPQASSAFASDSPVEPGVFGLGEASSVSLAAVPTARSKVPQAALAAPVPTAMTFSLARATAPEAKKSIVNPASKRAVTRIAKKNVVRANAKRTSGGTWKSARVSWYGPGFYGHGMAGGGKLTPTSMVLAHRSLPFGTKVAIKYHGKTVIAVVKDRGPFVSGRVFDLGPGVAKALGFGGVGTIHYRILGK